MFEPEAFFSDVNNLLGITGINQKIIDICNDRALCSKIKGNVQTYLIIIRTNQLIFQKNY